MTCPKILFGYSYFPSKAYPDIKLFVENYLNVLRKAGFNIEGFCLTIDPPGPRLSFADIDFRWRYGEKKLMQLYESLEKKLDGKDIFINNPGINLHPEFVEKLSVYKVFQCFDDPESSDDLSKPVAISYDLCLVGNIAEVDTYRSWGVTNVEWSPAGLFPQFYDPKKTYDEVINNNRDIDLFMLCDRFSPWRQAKVDRLYEAFPGGHFYGNGWPRGFLPYQLEMQYMSKVKIGPNIHNSTGPVNKRTFYLPANGILQICDNKSHLGKVFELGKEVLGFDTIEECIDLSRYYLAHENERKEIAAAGYRRAIKDYNEVAVFEREVKIIERFMKPKNQNCNSINITGDHANKVSIFRHLYIPARTIYRLKRKLNKWLRRLVKLFPGYST
jgi:spore maturation protein CgeB